MLPRWEDSANCGYVLFSRLIGEMFSAASELYQFLFESIHFMEPKCSN